MEREILNKTITDAQAVIDEAKAKIKELDKPVLSLGDYGKSDRGYGSFIVTEGRDGKLHWQGVFGAGPNVCFSDGKDHFVRLGNIFDDIAAKTEKLDGFEMKGNAGDSIKVYDRETSLSDIVIKTSGCDVRFNLIQLDEFIANLQKVANYIKAKNNE